MIPRVARGALLLALALALPGTARADEMPPAGSVAATIPIATPRDITSGFGSLWIANGPTRTVTRLDPMTGAVRDVVPVPDPASVLAAGENAIWVTSFDGNTVTRIDPLTDRVTGTTSLAPDGAGPIGITTAAGAIWVANHDGTPTSSVTKLDPATLAPLHTIPAGDEPFAGPSLLAAGAGAVWTPVTNISAVVRIDASTDKVTAMIPVKGACGGIAANDTDVWVAGGGGPGCQPGITRIDAATNAVTGHVNAAGQTAPLALEGRTLWYGTWDSQQLGRLDTRTNTVTGLLKLPGRPFAIAAYGSYVWITDRDDGLLFKVHH